MKKYRKRRTNYIALDNNVDNRKARFNQALIQQREFLRENVEKLNFIIDSKADWNYLFGDDTVRWNFALCFNRPISKNLMIRVLSEFHDPILRRYEELVGETIPKEEG